MREYIVTLKRLVTKLCDFLDNHSYVVAVWNGVNWQVAIRGIDNRKLAVATRNVIIMKRHLSLSDTRVMTARFAAKHGID